MLDKRSDLDIVEVLFVDGCRNNRFTTVPSHFELWMFLMDILSQQVDALRIGISTHERNTGDVGSILLNEGIDSIGVKRKSMSSHR